MHQQIAKGKKEEILAWLEKGGASLPRLIEWRDENGDTPLQLAVQRDWRDVIEKMIVAGGDVNVITPEGYTMYHEAARSNALEVMAYLLTLPEKTLADEEIVVGGKCPQDALSLAVEHNHLAMAEMLLKYGMDPNRRDADGRTVLHRLIVQHRDNTDYIPMIRLLQRYGADGEKSLTPQKESHLMLAVKHYFYSAAEFFLQEGESPSQRNIHGETPLHKAAQNSRPSFIDLLARAGADINAQDKNGASSLHVAASRNQKNTVEALLKAGANPFLKDNKGRTADMFCQSALQAGCRILIARQQAAWKEKYGDNIDYGRAWRAEEKLPLIPVNNPLSKKHKTGRRPVVLLEKKLPPPPPVKVSRPRHKNGLSAKTGPAFMKQKQEKPANKGKKPASKGFRNKR